MSRLIALYPADWRDRYEAEFRILLADRPPTVSERLDIVVSAVDAHLHPQLERSPRVRDRIGVAVLVGLALFIAAIVLASNGPVRYDEYGTYRDGAAALAPFALAAALLSLGLVRVVVELPADAPGARFAGWVAAVCGPFWALMLWVVPLGLVFILGVLGLAVGARRARVWPAWAEIALVAALVVPAGLMVATLFLPWYAFRVAGVSYVIVFAPLSVIWLTVGSLVLRGWPARDAAQPTPVLDGPSA